MLLVIYCKDGPVEMAVRDPPGRHGCDRPGEARSHPHYITPENYLV